MSYRNRMIAGLSALVLALAPAGIEAQEKEARLAGPPPASAAPEIVDAMESIALARQLAQYGHDHQAPLALIAAAQILLEHPTQPLGVDPRSEGGQAGTGAGKAETDAAPTEVVELLQAASAAAAGNEHVLALVRSLRAQAETALRGAVGGPKFDNAVVQARSTNYYNISFRAGEPAVVTLRGDGDTDLDCYVYDENGYLIDSDVNYADTCYLQWNPRWTGNFRIEVRNLGRVWNRYHIQTN